MFNSILVFSPVLFNKLHHCFRVNVQSFILVEITINGETISAVLQSGKTSLEF